METPQEHDSDTAESPIANSQEQATADFPAAWFEAAGIADDSSAFSRRVLQVAGEFLRGVGQLAGEAVLEHLADIDFTQSVTVVRLPSSSFIRSEAANGCWYTDTGLPAEQLRSIRGPRRRRLYIPVGVIPALKARSRTVRDGWSQDQLFGNIAPQIARQASRMSASGGTQYLVFNHSRLREA